MNHIEQFRDAIRAAGMTPPEEIRDDGKLHRFAPYGKKHDDAGWYVLHGDGVPAGAFGDWRTGLSETWRADIGRPLTPAEDAAHRERCRAAQQARGAEEVKRRADAAEKAKGVWISAKPADDSHDYLRCKRVQAHGLRLADDGRLIVPMRADGAIVSLQYISADGEKRFLPGGRVEACYFSIGKPDGAPALCIAEGYATGATIYESTRLPVAVAFNAGNLLAVTKSMRTRFPVLPIVICADDDYRIDGNPGLTKATEAARAVGCVVAVPDFGDDRPDGATDFNDMAQLCGQEAVKRAISNAQTPDVGAAIKAADRTPTVDCGACAVSLVRGSDIVPRPVQWVWDGWLAAGKLHVLAGQPGVGKSTIAFGLAATITQGGRWPDGTRAPVGNVLIWSGEDDPADTIVPRLMAMGADMSRVYFVGDVRDGAGRVAFDPSRHLAALELEAARIGGVKLVIVDPIVSAVSGDSHKNAEVRRSLQPLVDLATKLDCAILGVSHFTKGTAGRDPVERVTGSLAFGALARIVIVAAKLPENDSGKTGRLLARAKSNIGPDGGGFAYDIEQVPIPSVAELFGSCVLWGDVIDGTARELLAEAEATGDEPHVEREKAAGWLRECLAHGPVSSRQIKVDCDGAGFSWRTIQRAQKALGIVAKKEGMKGGWIWQLPDPDSPKNANIAEERQQNSLAAFGQVGALRGDDDAVEVEF